jgi:hypothetical protein
LARILRRKRVELLRRWCLGLPANPFRRRIAANFEILQLKKEIHLQIE